MKYGSSKRSKFGLASSKRDSRRQIQLEAYERRRAEEDEDGAIGASAAGQQFYQRFPLEEEDGAIGASAAGGQRFHLDWQQSEAAARAVRLELERVFGKEVLQEETEEIRKAARKEERARIQAGRRLRARPPVIDLTGGDDDNKCSLCSLMYGSKKRRSAKKHLRKSYRRRSKRHQTVN